VKLHYGGSRGAVTSQQRGVTVSRCWQSSLSKVGLIARAYCLVWWHLTPIPLAAGSLSPTNTTVFHLPSSEASVSTRSPINPRVFTETRKLTLPARKKNNDLERVTHLLLLIRITVAHLRYLSISQLFLTLFQF